MIGLVYGAVATAIVLLGAREVHRAADGELVQVVPYLAIAVAWPAVAAGAGVGYCTKLLIEHAARSLRRR